MGNFKFKSQICTTKEQSERLLALGLKKETADMVYIPYYKNLTLHSYFKPKVLDDDIRHYMVTDTLFYDYIPAWSLHRLMLIANANDTAFLNIENMYETLIKMIASNIKFGFINKDYLEEKK